jgi:hypothetical protein
VPSPIVIQRRVIEDIEFDLPQRFFNYFDDEVKKKSHKKDESESKEKKDKKEKKKRENMQSFAGIMHTEHQAPIQLRDE